MLVASALVLSLSAETSDAQRWNTRDRCYPAVEGIGRATGAFGLGTSRARAAARADWENAAARSYGPSASRLRFAQNIQWDCKRLAVLRAKCVVVAKPCGARIRG
ncbi:MAG: hypothetical protein CTY31_12675 [Hyphomicrobium sp.]|nr:MAG: hypothetical protein CTY31_12675 [Hyphomicrobium sp.]